MVQELRTLGFESASIDIKSVDSFAEKVVRKTKKLIKETGDPNVRYNPNDINDLVRGTVVVSNENKALEIAQKLKPVKPFDNYFRTPTNGYRGINADLLLPDGLVAELQIHTPATLKRASICAWPTHLVHTRPF